MVAAWISAETGVGPAMASGNHAWSGNWPDLPHAPSNSSSVIASSSPEENSPALAKTSVYWVVPRVRNIMKIAMARPTSPTRFITNAFLAAVAASGRWCQNAISRYEARPTPSQPRYSVTKLFPRTSTSIAATNRLR
nr:hypothetical protein GCM10020241_41700 [Streptoalloteichus tenebrarius]